MLFILFIVNCFTVYGVDATQLWALLVKICRAGRLKDEQQKCAFNLRTDEASAAHYFQVERIIKMTSNHVVAFKFLYIHYSGMVTCANNRTCYR